jgi:uncharacterized protein (DUF1501 family)
MLAIGLTAPSWLSALAKADVIRAGAGGINSNTTLIVVQLTGGNDGLNTVIPYAQSEYYKLRPSLALPEQQTLKLNDQLALHPALVGLHSLYQQKKVAIIQGVGYPNPNRSHFKSMEIWQSASPEGRLRHGWVGRHFDQQMARGALNPVVALGLSTEKPRALEGAQASIPCFASLVDIQSMIGDADAEQQLRRIQGANTDPNARVVQQANKSALDAMKELQGRLAQVQPRGNYGVDAFGAGFRQIAHLVAASPQTRLIYFSVGGFDTHARQAEQHQRLLQGFSDATTKFQQEMDQIGASKRVLVLVFSEFGRRAYQNGSAGTDHGAAAPMFLIGDAVKPGLHGPKPDLSKLQQGDIPFSIDFRSVYAATIDHWLEGDSATVLGGEFRSLNPIAQGKS